MNSPLYQAIEKIIKQDHSRFCMPGHKGKSLPVFGDTLLWDVTEIEGTDSLYEANGAIQELENRLTQIYGHTTLISAGGSTLGIQTMLALGVGAKGKVIVGRGCHTAAINAMSLLEIEPLWVYPTQNKITGLMNPLEPNEVEQMLVEYPDVKAVYVTSPNYYGQNENIAELSEICHKYNALLLVDSAHGAHYKFLSTEQDVMDLGADISCGSLHKTLPAVTGSAMLQLGEQYAVEDGKKWMSLFGSTSPSYLIMMSIDILLPYLEKTAKKDFEMLLERVSKWKERAIAKGVGIPQGDFDPARLTIGFGACGYAKEEFLNLLEHSEIIPEYVDNSYCVLLPSTTHTEKDWQRLDHLLDQMEAKKALPHASLQFPKLEQEISLQKAVFSKSHKIETKDALGKIAGSMVSPCPPGIPLVAPGEKITQEVILELEKHGVFTVNVL